MMRENIIDLEYDDKEEKDTDILNDNKNSKEMTLDKWLS